MSGPTGGDQVRRRIAGLDPEGLAMLAEGLDIRCRPLARQPPAPPRPPEAVPAGPRPPEAVQTAPRPPEAVQAGPATGDAGTFVVADLPEGDVDAMIEQLLARGAVPAVAPANGRGGTVPAGDAGAAPSQRWTAEVTALLGCIDLRSGDARSWPEPLVSVPRLTDLLRSSGVPAEVVVRAGMALLMAGLSAGPEPAAVEHRGNGTGQLPATRGRDEDVT